MQRLHDAVDRLNGQLPLRERQQALSPEERAVHRAILEGFARAGLPPNGLNPTIVERLADDDLVVRSVVGEVVGAYPFTLEETPHHMTVDGRPVNAMCSLDAVAVAPVFGRDVVTDSICAMSGEPIVVHQRAADLVAATPTDLRIGIRWQEPDGCAAHSMCRDMVFLAGPAEADRWATDGDVGIFTLHEAIEFGRRFFGPLVG